MLVPHKAPASKRVSQANRSYPPRKTTKAQPPQETSDLFPSPLLRSWRSGGWSQRQTSPLYSLVREKQGERESRPPDSVQVPEAPSPIVGGWRSPWNQIEMY
jgi:hypothetical protein